MLPWQGPLMLQTRFPSSAQPIVDRANHGTQSAYYPNNSSADECHEALFARNVVPLDGITRV